MTDLVKLTREAGIVGAGGAGFPTYVKINSYVDTFIANCAECEPLLYKDKEIIKNFTHKVMGAIQNVLDATGAKKGFIAVKKKYSNLFFKIKGAINDERISIYGLDDYYPAGDEVELVYEITGKVINEGDIPLSVGVLVHNIETLYNISLALEGKPVIKKFLTINGCIKEPFTASFSIGTPIYQIVKSAQPSTQHFSIIEGGPMMGSIVEDEREPVKKTTSGIIVLPEDHPLIKKKKITTGQIEKIVQYCTNCTRCTDLCPRHLLGQHIEPHKIMRNVGYRIEDRAIMVEAYNCCQCAICENFACPVELPPMSLIKEIVEFLKNKGIPPKISIPGQVDVEKEGRRIPFSRLVQRLGIEQYNLSASLRKVELNTDEYTILLKQHIGVPASPIVKKGEKVKKGQKIGDVPETEMGVPIHSPINGTINFVDDKKIIVRRGD